MMNVYFLFWVVLKQSRLYVFNEFDFNVLNNKQHFWVSILYQQDKIKVWSFQFSRRIYGNSLQRIMLFDIQGI